MAVGSPEPATGSPVQEQAPGRRRWPLIAAIVAFAIPLLVAAAVLKEPRWFPSADLALIELRVRDVPTDDPPLLGLGGRIGDFGEDQGSHPGPLAFFLIWPVYALLGSSSWAFQVATLALHLTAAAVALWLGYRRGGTALLVGTAAVLALLARAYGVELLAEPWNPFLPVLAFIAFVLAVWSVTCGDLLALVVVTVAGSLCLQTHLPYGGVVGAGTLVAFVAVALHLRARWRQPRARAPALRYTFLGIAAGVLVWIPPVAEQLGGGRGNLRTIYEYFRDPPEAPLGLSEGARLLLRFLDPFRLAGGDLTIRSFPASWTVVPGTVLVLALLVSAGVAWRLGHQRLVRLHLVLAVLLTAAVVALSRIFGPAWNYLSLWVWGLNALMLLAIGWTAVAAVRRRWPGLERRAAAPWALAAPACVALVALGLLTADATSATMPDPRLSQAVGAISRPAAERLDDPDVPGGGRDGTYWFTFVDPVDGGFPAFGMFDELEREGYTLGVDRVYRAAVAPHRLMEPDEATGELHLAVGKDLEKWRSRDDAVEIAAFDPRDRRERAEFEDLQRSLAAELRAAGDDDLVELLDDVAALMSQPRLTEDQRRAVGRMFEIGLPMALFAAPPPRGA